MLALGAFATPASADWDNDHRGYHHNWNGGYYAAPPVVYGSPYGQSDIMANPITRRRSIYGPGVGHQHPNSLSITPIKMATAGIFAGRLLSSRAAGGSSVKKIMISSLIVGAPFLLMFLAWKFGIR